MIYKRYGGSAKDILAMPFFDGYELITYALNEEIEDKLYLRWMMGYQIVMSYEEFKSQMNINVRAKHDKRTEEEIFDYVLNILGDVDGNI